MVRAIPSGIVTSPVKRYGLPASDHTASSDMTPLTRISASARLGDEAKTKRGRMLRTNARNDLFMDMDAKAH
jgi:hypothetical protein